MNSSGQSTSTWAEGGVDAQDLITRVLYRCRGNSPDAFYLDCIERELVSPCSFVKVCEVI